MVAFAAVGLWSTGGGPPAPDLASAADLASTEEVEAPQPVAEVRAEDEGRTVEQWEEPQAQEPPTEAPAEPPTEVPTEPQQLMECPPQSQGQA